ncbi:TatD family deoxyribonuclease [Patescibacteria group bacterium]|nr:MAG: TatD family deoxyribonuclease [Patescibacteria group bacterium]
MLIDTHCHIHEVDYPLDITETIQHAHDAGVDHFLCVGTSLDSSRRAIDFAQDHPEASATVGIHPHETKDGWEELAAIIEKGSVVAVGEIGLDYYYNHSPRDVQTKALKWQIELALQYDLPIIFHVRDAFDDFWPVFDSYKGDIRGELHSFTDNKVNLDEGLRRGLYIGVNGISTFTKDESQRELFASIPLDRLLLETDAPFLTPIPFRGKSNEPAYVKNIAEYQAVLRGMSLEQVANATTANARALFGL